MNPPSETTLYIVIPSYVFAVCLAYRIGAWSYRRDVKKADSEEGPHA